MVKMAANVGSLEEQALKRKEKILALKRKRTGETSDNVKTSDEHKTLPKPKFRNYAPENDKLIDYVVPDAKVGDVESEIKEQLDAAKSHVVIDELDITNLAPRKPDWDLKRDVAKKLEKLERRTQKAIAELIRERLKERQADIAAIADTR